MQQKKSLTLNGLTTPNVINLLMGLGIIGLTIYLTSYFFDAHFPAGIAGNKGMCDLNSFFTCSGATLSPVSNLFGIPVAFFGLIFGISIVVGTIFPSENFERTNKLISVINLPGILFFLIYSLTALGTLCPMCTLYYVLSGISAFLYFKYGVDGFSPGAKVLSILAVVTIAGSVLLSNHYHDKKERFSKINQQIVEQYKILEDLGPVQVNSPYYIVEAQNAPIQMTVFSDFECPFCSILSEQLEKMKNEPKYKGKLNIQYMFYPLDNFCNPGIKRKFHEYACKAAYVAACDAQKFVNVHDDIFHNQKSLDDDLLTSLEKKYGLKDCINNQAAKDFVASSIQEGDRLGLNSTPTIFLNGRKIEGSIPNKQFYAIFDYILEQSK